MCVRVCVHVCGKQGVNLRNPNFCLTQHIMETSKLNEQLKVLERQSKDLETKV